MGSTAATAAPPAHAAPVQAPVQAVARTKRSPVPKGISNQSLLRIQRCSCGDEGTCDGCRRKRIQAKVEVGGRDDAYEREADAIAARVMRGAEPAGATGAEERIQRRCSACEEEEKIQRKPAERPESDEEAAGTMALGGAMLTQGGAPLPRPVQGYFERRFGRDFSSVRVHEGEAAAQASDGLGALAFTYGSHIWLGRGARAGAHALMAHELAHVLQQTSPPALGGPGTVAARGSAPRVQRMFGVPYFEPEGRGGTATHEEVLPALRAKGTDLITEAPIPNGNEKGVGEGKFGYADLYTGNSISGLYFMAHQKHTGLRQRRLMVNGNENGNVTVAPVSNGLNASVQITGVTDAPKNVKVGDLKPVGERAHSGVTQLNNYMDGLELCRKHVMDVRSRDGDWNKVKTGVMGRDDLIVPSRFQPPFSGQTPRDLVLKRALWLPGGKVVSEVIWYPDPPINGHLGVNYDARHPGIWNHFWVPQSVAGATLPLELTRLEPEVQQRIIDPFYEAPVQAQGKPRPVEARRETRPRVRRKAPKGTDVVDPFQKNYGKWKQNLAKRTSEFSQFSKSKKGKDAAGRLMAVEALEVLHRQSGFKNGLPPVPKGAEAESRKLSKIDFWTGPSAGILGRFRNAFGGAFVAVARLYLKGREKFRDLLKNRQPRFGLPGGALGAAMRVAFRVAKEAVRFLAARVVDKLWDSLAMGLTAKIKALIPEHVTEELEEKIEEVKALQEKLEQAAMAKLEPMITELVKPYEDEVKWIHEVHDKLSDLASLINIVRWGARAIACLSPPGFGCLWLLGEAIIDKFIARIIESCKVQRKITPMIAEVDMLRKIPVKIANLIIERARKFLPGPVGDVLVTLPDSELVYEVSSDEIPCEKGSGRGGDDLTPQQEALLRLQEKIGDERKIAALAKLAKASNVNKDAQLSEADIDALAEAIAGISTDQLEAWAADYKKPPKGTPVPFQKFFDKMVAQRIEAARAGSKDPIPTPPVPLAPPPPPPPPPAQGGGGEEKGGGEQEGGAPVPEGEKGPGGVKVYNAKDVTYKGTEKAPEPGSTVAILGASTSHTVDSGVPIDIMGFSYGQAIALVRRVPVLVKDRTFAPAGSNADSAHYLVLHYQLLQGIDIPGVGTLQKGRMICYYHGWKAGVASEATAKECP